MNSLKIAVLIAIVSLSAGSAFSKDKVKECSLFLMEPNIIHTTYGSNIGGNGINNNVIRMLQSNGFEISTSISKARYVMSTEVRCGHMWTLFGLQDACQTAVTFEDQRDEKIVYTDGPTAAKPGLSIDFDSVHFPKCSEL